MSKRALPGMSSASQCTVLLLWLKRSNLALCFSDLCLCSTGCFIRDASGTGPAGSAASTALQSLMVTTSVAVFPANSSAVFLLQGEAQLAFGSYALVTAPSAKCSTRKWLWHCLQVYLKHGVPRVRPFPAALKQWAQPVTSSHDFQYAMLSLLFLGSKPIALVCYASIHISCLDPATARAATFTADAAHVRSSWADRMPCQSFHSTLSFRVAFDR